METKLHYFDWLKSQPKHQSAFNTVMGIQRMNRGEEWFKCYPVEDRLRAASTEPLLVDVGGGLRHDLLVFKKAFPELPGRLIIQDLPVVIDDIKDPPYGIEAMKHDFFTPQPIKDAKAYYLRTVPHDWPDKQARCILSNIRLAMSKNSILLINEDALPEDNVPLYPTQLDISMMAAFPSLDRTQLQFKKLLESAGFRLVKVQTPKVMVPGSGTLFEAFFQQ